VIDGLKPYPAYKESGAFWLGPVPEHWGMRKLKYAVTFSGGGTPSKANASFWNGHIPWVSPKDMKRQWINDATDHISDDAVKASSTSLIPPGALLMVVRSGILQRTIPVAINTVTVTLNQDMKALRPTPHIMSQYLRSLVQGHDSALITIWTKQGATVESIEHELLANSVIPIPPPAEQAVLVRFLDHADRLIHRFVRAKKKLIALLTEQKQTIIHQAVTRGLDRNVKLTPSGVGWLNAVPEHWEIKRAKCFYREVDERSVTGDEELMSVSHTTGVTPRKHTVTMFMSASNIGHKICRPGDIVINTMWAFMAALGVAKQLGVVSPSYGVYRPHAPDHMVSGYFDLLLRTPEYKAEYLRRSTGITSSRLRLYPDQFLSIPLLRPPESEQETIVKYVEAATADIQRAINQTQREIDLIQEYRTRLIADVVTGKVDVRETAARLPEEMEEPDAIDESEDIAEFDEDMEGEEVVAEAEA
jgi:type I restriction enzyme, S subunit